MSSVALNLGIEALLAAQTALDTVGHNVANANTPGYSRQTVRLIAGPAMRLGNHLVGNGVRAEDIVSVRDLLVDRRILTQRSAIGRLDALSSGLSDVESLLGEPGEGSLSSMISGFFSGVSRLSANPGDTVLRRDAIGAGSDLAERFRSLRAGLETLRGDAAARVDAQVERVNELTSAIATMNRAIGATEIDGSTANDLRDQRDEQLRQLADVIDVAVVERDDGTVAVTTRGQVLVTGTRNFEMDGQTSLAQGVELRILGSDQPLVPQGGSLGGLYAQVDSVLPERLQKLDDLARTFVHEINKAHSTGVPGTGPFRSLESTNPLHDVDEDGAYDDELLAMAGLPFPIQDGALLVNVTDRVTGDVETVRIDIDAEETTVGDFVDALNAIPQMTAVIEGEGQLSLRAAEGFGFDFAARSYPSSGTLGGSQVAVSGQYAGDAASDLTFRPRSTGNVGETPDLLVDVFDANGDRVATLDVGAGYVPGSELDLGNGLRASFDLGTITNADSFELHAAADGDTADVLAALGVNTLFSGTSAADIEVSQRLLSDPRLLAASATGADGDGGALADILAVSEASLESLGGSSPIQYVGGLVAGIGFDRASAELAMETEQALHDGLVAQRDARSAVNVDEELVDMLRFQQSYQAAAQFIQVVNGLNDELLRLL